MTLNNTQSSSALVASGDKHVFVCFTAHTVATANDFRLSPFSSSLITVTSRGFTIEHDPIEAVETRPCCLHSETCVQLRECVCVGREIADKVAVAATRL